MKTGKTQKTIVRWSSTNKKVAAVSKKGVVTAKKAGVAYIRARIGQTTKKCRVTVRKGHFTLTKKKYRLPINGCARICCRIKGLKDISAGTATITARGSQDTCIPQRTACLF